MPRKHLTEVLWVVAREIAEEVIKRSSEGMSFTRREQILRPVVRDFKYSEGGGLGYSSSMEPAEVEVQDMSAVTRLVTELSERDSFKQFQSEVLKALGPGPIDYRLAPTTFLTNAITLCAGLIQETRLYPELLERGLAKSVTSYYARIAGAPAEVSLTVWLEGVWLKPESIEPTDWLTIRRTNANDLASDMARFRGYLSPIGLGPPSVTSAAAEVSLRQKTPASTQERVDLLCNALRLCKVCPVFAVRWDYRDEGPFGGSQQWSNVRPAPGLKVPLDTGDVAPIRKAIEILEGSTLIGPKSSGNTPIKVAFERYSEALLGSLSPEARMTAAITALEAILLGTEERAELTHRLGQRVATLMAALGDPPIEVYQKVSRAYDVRSKFIHGSGLEGDERKGLDKLLERVLEITRTSISLLLQALEREKKDDFISRIDNAVLDLAARERLKSIMDGLETFRT